MKNLFLTIFLLFFILFEGFAQKECDVLYPSPPVFVTTPKAFTSYTFKVYYHIIRKNNGNKPSVNSQEVVNAHNILNSNYLSSNICFVMSGITWIDDNDFYNFDFSSETASNAESEELFATDAHTDGIDVYIIHDQDDDNELAFNGRVNSIPGNGIIIQSSKFQESTLSHEMGHIMGLYHCFEPSICIEEPDGSNSSICGDLVEDTPACTVACRYLTSTCQFPCSVSYDVSDLLDNFMMYADNLSCRTSFTNGQQNRMYGMIDITADLQQRLVPENRTVASQNIPLISPGLMISDFAFEAKGTLTVIDVNIQVPGKGAFRAEEEVIILPGFDALQGCRALVIIENICKANETPAKSHDLSIDSYENEGTRMDDEQDDELLAFSLLESNTISLEKSEVIIYPNPFNESVHFKLNSDGTRDPNEKISIEFIDLNGKVVLNQDYTIGDLNDGIEVNTLTLQQGFFIVYINFNDNRIISKITKL